MNKEYEMQKRTLELQKRLQESKDLDTLQSEISSLVELYRYYDKLYGEEFSKNAATKIDEIEQVEKLLGIAEKQMNLGIISREHFLAVARQVRKNLLLIYRSVGISQYANLLVGESAIKEDEISESSNVEGRIASFTGGQIQKREFSEVDFLVRPKKLRESMHELADDVQSATGKEEEER